MAWTVTRNKIGLERMVFNKLVPRCSWISERLGYIKERKDGRWGWWRRESFFHEEWGKAKQGVTETREDAMEMVLKGGR